MFSTKKYKDFNEYMEENYYDDIVKWLGAYIICNRDSFENDEFHKITWIDQDEITYTISGTTFKDLGDGYIEIRTSVDADVRFSGYTKYGQDSDSDTRIYNVFFKARLDDGLHDVRITDVSEYNAALYDRDKTLSQSWLPYMYEEDVDKHAEDFLRRNYSKALLQSMPIDPFEVVKAMKMKMYYAPLGDKIFGKTYFGEETVTVYDDIVHRNTKEIVTTPGTMLINPDVFFMRNIGTAYNTIIHECVHWDRHRRAFELQRLLQGGAGHISCEMVEGEYNGIGSDESALKWMEWQANQLAPRILMPEKTTRRIYNKFLQDEYTAHPKRRYAETLQEVVGQVANYFSVSLLAAKLRLFELGYEEVEGTFVYCNGQGLPPYAYRKGALDKNHSFVVDEQNLIISLITNPRLMELYSKGAIVYANCMLCLNDPKYVTLNEVNKYIPTEYALEHVDECCFVFKRKYSASDKYPDTFYRRCYLCREIDAEEFVPVEYDSQHKINQTKEEMQDEIDTILNTVSRDIQKMNNEMKGGFAGALDYFMTTKKITAEELQGRSGVSTVSISGYRNSLDAKIEKSTALALCKGLCLMPYQAEIFLDRAGYSLSAVTPSNVFIRNLVTNHMDDTWEQWVIKIRMFGMANDWIPNKNPLVKKIDKAQKTGEIEKFL